MFLNEQIALYQFLIDNKVIKYNNLFVLAFFIFKYFLVLHIIRYYIKQGNNEGNEITLSVVNYNIVLYKLNIT